MLPLLETLRLLTCVSVLQEIDCLRRCLINSSSLDTSDSLLHFSIVLLALSYILLMSGERARSTFLGLGKASGTRRGAYRWLHCLQGHHMRVEIVTDQLSTTEISVISVETRVHL